MAWFGMEVCEGGELIIDGGIWTSEGIWICYEDIFQIYELKINLKAILNNFKFKNEKIG